MAQLDKPAHGWLGNRGRRDLPTAEEVDPAMLALAIQLDSRALELEQVAKDLEAISGRPATATRTMVTHNREMARQLRAGEELH